MRRFSFIVFILVVWLATCSGPKPDNPARVGAAPATDIPASATNVPPTPTETLTPAAKLPAASFDAQTYVNKEAGFALDYPTGWTLNEMVVGPRGTQVQFLSKPELKDAATIPAGETRFVGTIYLWDPKNDLAAYVAHWKDAWSASGFTILSEEQLTLEQGLPAVMFTVQSAENQIVFLVTALKDQYLVLSGEGNLDLVKRMMARLRPIS